MNITKLFLFCAVIYALVIVGVRGDNLFSICEVEDDEPEFEVQLMAFTNPTPGVCDWPRFAGALDEDSFSDGILETGGAIHVHTDGYLYGTTAPFYYDFAFEYCVLRDEAKKVEPKEPIGEEDNVFGYGWNVNGGQTVLRKVTGYSPNGRVDFQKGWSDSLISSVPGLMLTGDCQGSKCFLAFLNNIDHSPHECRYVPI